MERGGRGGPGAEAALLPCRGSRVILLSDPSLPGRAGAETRAHQNVGVFQAKRLISAKNAASVSAGGITSRSTTGACTSGRKCGRSKCRGSASSSRCGLSPGWRGRRASRARDGAWGPGGPGGARRGDSDQWGLPGSPRSGVRSTPGTLPSSGTREHASPRRPGAWARAGLGEAELPTPPARTPSRSCLSSPHPPDGHSGPQELLFMSIILFKLCH